MEDTMLKPPKYDDPYIGADEAYDSWKDEQGPNHYHLCAVCSKWIRDCYHSLVHCKDYDQEFCEACKAKAVAAD